MNVLSLSIFASRKRNYCVGCHFNSSASTKSFDQPLSTAGFSGNHVWCYPRHRCVKASLCHTFEYGVGFFEINGADPYRLDENPNRSGQWYLQTHRFTSRQPVVTGKYIPTLGGKRQA